MGGVDQVVADVRRFNRRWTQVLGLLDEGLLATEHPLPEARVLYELAQRPDVERAELRATLAIDDSFLSRLLARLQRKRLITTEASPLDGRRRRIVLTPAGRGAARDLDERSVAQIEALVAPLGGLGRDALTGAMAEIERLTGDRGDAPTITLRDDVRPGDLGWVVQRNAEVYAAEFGWDASYEALVAQIVGDFTARPRGRSGAGVDRRRRRPSRRLRVLQASTTPTRPSCGCCSSTRGPAGSDSAVVSSTRASTSPAPPATAG